MGAVQKRQHDASRQRRHLLRLAASGTYEQTLRVDGFRQQELNIVDPTFPYPAGAIGAIPPTNRYLLADDLRHGRRRASVSASITPSRRRSAPASRMRTSTDPGLLRGLNQNAPLDGARPNPLFWQHRRVVGDGSRRQNTVNAFLQVMVSPPSPNPSKQLWNWKRTNFGINYNWGRLRNNVDGAFSVPATGSLANEWGPGGDDVRNRLNAFFGTQALRNFNANLNVSMSTAPPYTIRSGVDLNGDLIFNDRPPGIARNTERGTGRVDLPDSVYTFMFGRQRIQLPPGIMINGSPAGDFRVTQMQADPLPRFRLGIVVNAQNLTNHTNYTGYQGSVTSPFFHRPTNVTGMRKIDVGLNFSF